MISFQFVFIPDRDELRAELDTEYHPLSAPIVFWNSVKLVILVLTYGSPEASYRELHSRYMLVYRFGSLCVRCEFDVSSI